MKSSTQRSPSRLNEKYYHPSNLNPKLLEKLQCQSCFSQKPTLNLQDTCLFCSNCEKEYPHAEGIPSLLSKEMRAQAARYNHHYIELRLREGWASDMPGYYEGLPYSDITHRHSAEWHIRAKHFERIQKWIQKKHGSKRLDILDAGAGSGWMSRILAQSGHQVIMTDVNSGNHGLGAVANTSSDLMPLQTTLEIFPFRDNSFDLVIFNASLHYSQSTQAILRETQRVLHDSGYCIIADSPIYSNEKALAHAKQRTEKYYRELNATELIPNYHPLLRKTLFDQPFYRINFLQKDISLLEWLKKTFFEKIGKTVGSYFPVVVCSPIVIQGYNRNHKEKSYSPKQPSFNPDNS